MHLRERATPCRGLVFPRPGSGARPEPGRRAPATAAARLPGMGTVILLRHGESDWNAKGLFTGWVDVGLSERGASEAAAGGRLLREAGLRPDVVHTSVLTRAIHTDRKSVV